MQGFTQDPEQIRQMMIDADGKRRTLTSVAEELGVSVNTVRKALVGMDRYRRDDVETKEHAEATRVFNELRSQMLAHGWAPSQRALAEATGFTVSRVNYLLQVLKHQGLIELGPNPREVRIVGSSMVIPEITM
jgi:DNA-binding GntR family transcriptional regulator